MNQRRDVLVRHGVIDSDKLARQPLALQLFFRNLLHLGDRNARFCADPDDIRYDLYRHALDRVKKHHIQDWLATCHRLGLIQLYTRSGKAFGQILNYGQTDTKRRALHPAPDDEPELPLDAKPPPRPKPPRPKTPAPPYQKRSEGKGEAPPAPQVETDEEWLARLARQYPHTDLRAELAKAKAKKPDIGRRFFEDHWLPNCEQPIQIQTAAGATITIEPEPEAWKMYLKDRYENESWAESAAACTWTTMPSHWRSKIAREMKEAS